MNIADLDLTALIGAMAADAPAPGAGAAGDVALALGAACAAKAFAISARHKAYEAALAQAAVRARAIAEVALQGAGWDAEAFAELLHGSGPGALRRDGTVLLAQAAALRALVEAHRPAVIPAMAGDLTAALALAAAFETIERRNLAELG